MDEMDWMDGMDRRERGACVRLKRSHERRGVKIATGGAAGNMGPTPLPIMQSIMSLNYAAVLVVAVVGFLVGWLWYGVLLGKAWMAEMKITEEKMKESQAKGMAGYFIKGFLCTLLGAFGLAVLLTGFRAHGWLKGAELGAFVGVAVVGARMLNAGVWEERSLRLQAINLGHELVMFTLQGAILGVWR